MHGSNLFSALKQQLNQLQARFLKNPNARVVTFGTFDPLHDGHKWLFTQAKQIGEHLTVVVARDNVIRAMKHREPFQKQDERLRNVQHVLEVNEAILGDEEPSSYTFLKHHDFDVLVVGHDQTPSDFDIQKLLQSLGKDHVRLVRMDGYFPEKYKSSLFRKKR